jgi:hypothetical protein
MSFERGQEVKKAVGLGLNIRYPKKGQAFFIRFKMKKSCPEYYPLQEKERNEISIVAVALEDSRMIYEPFDFQPLDFIKCIIPEANPDPFSAKYSEKNKCWVISDGYDV